VPCRGHSQDDPERFGVSDPLAVDGPTAPAAVEYSLGGTWKPVDKASRVTTLSASGVSITRD
jgi:hypothetical protein